MTEKQEQEQEQVQVQGTKSQSVPPGTPKVAKESGQCRVRFEPFGRQVDVPRGRRLYDLATQLKLPLAASCGGEGICGRCGVRVYPSGQEALSPERPAETARKTANRIDPGLRLACLTVARGDVVVTTDYW